MRSRLVWSGCQSLRAAVFCRMGCGGAEQGTRGVPRDQARGPARVRPRAVSGTRSSHFSSLHFTVGEVRVNLNE
jgi:hypothetical protein